MLVFLIIIVLLFIVVKNSHKNSVKEKREVQEETVRVNANEPAQKSDDEVRMDYFNYRLKKYLLSRYPDMITFRYQDGGCPYVRQSFCVFVVLNDGKEKREIVESKAVWGGREVIELPDENEEVEAEKSCFSDWLTSNVGEIQRRMNAATKAGFERINYEVDLKTLPEGKTLEELAEIMLKNLDYDVEVLDENTLSIIDLDA